MLIFIISYIHIAYTVSKYFYSCWAILIGLCKFWLLLVILKLMSIRSFYYVKKLENLK